MLCSMHKSKSTDCLYGTECVYFNEKEILYTIYSKHLNLIVLITHYSMHSSCAIQIITPINKPLISCCHNQFYHYELWLCTSLIMVYIMSVLSVHYFKYYWNRIIMWFVLLAGLKMLILYKLLLSLLTIIEWTLFFNFSLPRTQSIRGSPIILLLYVLRIWTAIYLLKEYNKLIFWEVAIVTAAYFYWKGGSKSLLS